MRNIKDIDCFKNCYSDHMLDYLTGTLNKENLFYYIKNLIHNKEAFSLFFFDVDEFKKLNDLKGHSYGDYILKNLINVISEAIEDKATIGRFGGDEFMIIAENVIDYDDTWNLARKICTAVRKFSSEEAKKNDGIYFSITVGVVRFPIDASNINDLIKLADKALYRGKKKGRDCFIIYNAYLHGQINTDSQYQIDLVSIIQYCYNEFTTYKDSLDNALNRVELFLSNNFMVDSLIINDIIDTKCYCHFDKCKAVEKIDCSIYNGIFDDSENIFIINSRDFIKDKFPKLFDLLVEIDVRGLMLIRLNLKDGGYSYIHINSHRSRIWSRDEQLVFLSVFQMYSLIKNNK